MSQKKYGVVDYEYFKNVNTQQYNIFRHFKYNFCVVVCEISTPHVKRSENYELWVKRDLKTIKQQIYTQAYIDHPSPF